MSEYVNETLNAMLEPGVNQDIMLSIAVSLKRIADNIRLMGMSEQQKRGIEGLAALAANAVPPASTGRSDSGGGA